MFAWRDQYLSYNGPSGPAGDPYWSYVSLLENFEYPQTIFVDSSTYNFPLTPVGDVKPSLKTPFSGGVGGSMYFDGSGDYCSVPDNSAFQMTGDFTMEAWVYLSVAGTRRSIFVHWPGAVAANCAFAFEVFSNNQIYFSYGIGGTTGFKNSVSTVPSGQWVHVAVARQGTNFRFFIAGVLTATTTLSGSLNNGTGEVRVGSMPTEGNFMNGFISNLRVVNGTALYTATFTPPTTILTNVPNTVFLMNGTNQGLINNSTFIDSTTTRPAALTQSGSIAYSGLSPFTNSYPGSMFVDGSGTLTSTTSVIQTGNFTIEMYVNCAVPASFNGFFNLGSETTGRLTFGVLTSGGNMLPFYNPFGGANQTFGIFPPNQWNHIAWVRSGTTVTCYVNGTQSGTTKTLSGNAGNTGGCVVGHSTNMTGYITNVRLTSTALYLGSFTPSTTPLPMVSGTVFLLACNGANQDLSNSGQRIATTTTNCVISTQQKKFGTQSSLYTATGYQTVYNFSSTSLQLTGDFTIEGWVYRTSVGVIHSIIGKGNSSLGWLLQINSSNQLTWTSGASIIKTGTTSIPANTWTYFAVTRSGSTCYMFINGTLEGSSFTDATSYNQTQDMKIGSDRSNANGLSGYLDDIRITKGVCRYTSSFSAPTDSFPTS